MKTIHSAFIQISRSLGHLVIALFLVSRETLHNFPNTTQMGILSEDECNGLKQLFVYSFREKKTKTIPRCVGYMDVCTTEIKVTPLYIFINKTR